MNIMNTRYGKISLLSENDLISKSLYLYGEWAQAEIDLYCKFISVGDVVLDVGAYIGTHTLAFACAVGPTGQVHAFEPQPRAFSALKRMIAENGLSQVSPYNSPVAPVDAYFLIPPVQEDNGGGLQLSRVDADVSGSITGVPLDALTLERCDFLKLDVEGMEPIVLATGSRLVERFRPLIACECNFLEPGAGVLAWSQSSRYRVFGVSLPAFNPSNFLGNQANIFQDCAEVTLFLAPEEREDIQGQLMGYGAKPVRSLDELALLMREKPQYASEAIDRANLIWRPKGNRNDCLAVREAEAGSNLSAPGGNAAQRGFIAEGRAGDYHFEIVELLKQSLHANLAAFERAMSVSAEQVIELKNAVTCAHAENDRLSGRLREVERASDAASAERERLISALRHVEQKNDEVLNELELKSRLLEQTTQRVEAVGAELERLRGVEEQRCHELRSALNAAQQQVVAVHASSSWRITAPLRAVVTQVRGLRKRVAGLASSPSRPARALLRVLRFGWRLVLGRPRAAMAALRGQPYPPSPLDSGTQAFTPVRAMRFARYEVHIHKARADVAWQLPASGLRRVICVSHVLPFPARAGNEYRIHRMLNWMQSDGCDAMLVVCPLNGEEISAERFSEAAAQYPRLVVLSRDGNIRANFKEAKEWLKGALPKQPRDFSSLLPIAASELSAPVEEICRAFCPDVLLEVVLALQKEFGAQFYLAQYVFMTRVFDLLPPGVIKIVDTHDVFSTKKAKVARYGIEDGLALSAADEAALMVSADVLIGIQPLESRELVLLAPHARVVTAGVDFPVEESFPPPPGNKVILLVASGNPMNVKGLRDFIRFGWPIVRRDCPDAQLRVVGDVGRFLGFAPSGVSLLGRVEDLAAAYAQSDVVINPAVAGTGLKIKTIEALCHLRPVVTFPSGADGMGEVARQFLRVAENWYEFAQLLVEQLKAETSSRLHIQAEMLATEFAPENVYAELKEVIHGHD